MAMLKKKIGILTGVGNEKIVLDGKEFYKYDSKLKELAGRLKKHRVEIGVVNGKAIYIKKAKEDRSNSADKQKMAQKSDNEIEKLFLGKRISVVLVTKEKLKGNVTNEEKHWIVLDDKIYLNRQHIVKLVIEDEGQVQ